METGEFLWASDFPPFPLESAPALEVAELTLHLQSLLAGDEILRDVWVRGEVSNLTTPASGHLYFSLKDATACLQCVLWRSTARRLETLPEVGARVRAHGRIEVYPARGQYQLVVDALEPDGEGAIRRALEALRARLREEGLFDSARKRPLPAFPERVAVVTSLTGAAVRDICAVLAAAAQKPPGAPEVLLVPAVVQGEAAEASLCAALQRADAESGADLLLLARGGGSAEDLFCFNSERLVRTIAATRTPVVSAVGHETDVTLADLVADWRAPTPTAAATLIVELRQAMFERAVRAAAAARRLFLGRAESARLRWEGLCRRAPLARPETLLLPARRRLDAANERLARAARQLLETRRHRLAVVAGRLDAVSPLATLARGYALVRRLPDGAPIRRLGQLQSGDHIDLRFADGHAEAWVLGLRPDSSAPNGPGPDARKGVRR